MKISKLQIIILLAGILVILPVVVLAQPDLGLNEAADIGLGGTDIKVTITNIIRIALGFLGIVAVGIILYGGFRWMTAGGDVEKVTHARKWLINGAIGLVIILAAFGIASFIFSSLSDATGLNNSNSGGGGGGGGGTGSYLVVNNIKPSNGSTDVIRNAVIKIYFNRNIEPASVVESDFVMTQVDDGSTVPFSVTTTGQKIEIRPTRECEVEAAEFCLAANTEYRVEVLNGSVTSVDNKDLSCGISNCISSFTTGLIVDTEDPTVSIVEPLPYAVYAEGSLINIIAQAQDDSGVAAVEFYVNNSSLGYDSDGEPWVMTWDITGQNAGSAHQIQARAEDYDDHDAYSARVPITIRPQYCFNGVQDGDETGVDCGGSCGGCLGDSCDIDQQTPQCDADPGFCAVGSCDIFACVCTESPVITNVTPDNGAVGNYVTIYGAGFGNDPGVVTFLGTTAVGDEVNASLATCTSAWQNNQVIVLVPEGGVSGAIRLTSVGGGFDTTLDERGWQGEFAVNDTVRPGVCSVNPPLGTALSDILTQGTQFSTNNPDNKIFVGGIRSAVNDWTNQSIDSTVPNLEDGTVSVYVQVDGENSNPVAYTVVPAEDRPQISYLDPVQGPIGQYVTIYGSNFGFVGSDLLINFKNAAGESVSADIDFPEACGDWSPSDTEILIKVPDIVAAGYNVGNWTVSVNRVGKESNAAPFVINTEPLTPGLCLLDPNNGPVGTPVKLYGEGFGQTKGTVGFHDNVSAVVIGGNWSENVITTGVPVQAITGPASMRTSTDINSNSLNFTVGMCTIDSCSPGSECCGDGVCRATGQCDTGLGANEYTWEFITGAAWPPFTVSEAWPMCDDACLNSSIGAQFTNPLDISTLANYSIHVYPCGDAECSRPNWEPEITYSNQGNEVGYYDVENYILNIVPAADLLPGKYYRVVIMSGSLGVANADGGFLENMNYSFEGGEYDSYSWTFRTGNRICAIDRVDVKPAGQTLLYQTDRLQMSAYPYSEPDSCSPKGQALNGFSYDWTWNSVNGSIAQVTAADGATDNLVYWWRFDENVDNSCGNGADACDSGASTRNGTILGQASWTSGERCQNGNCLDYSGNNSFVYGGIPYVNTHTACAYASADQIREQGLLSAYDNHGQWNHRLYMKSDGKITYELGCDNNSNECGTVWKHDITTSVALNAGQKYHICGVYDKANMAIYIDGQMVASAPETRNLGNGGLPYFVGTTSYTTAVPKYQVANTWDGTLDEARLYSTALSAEQIMTLRNFDGRVDPRAEVRGISNGTTDINATATGTTGSASVNVSFDIPTITSISPDNGMIREGVFTYVTISGSNFGPVQGSSYVLVGDKPAVVADCAGSWSDTQIIIRLPLSTQTGDRITVVKQRGSATSAQSFTVNELLRPALCSINPNFGTDGTAVNLDGHNFGDTEVNSTVRFDQLTANPAQSWSNENILTAVPVGVATGPVTVKVLGNNSNPVVFRTPPYIDRIEPNRGPIGRYISIYGGNFGHDQNSGYVVIGGIVTPLAQCSGSWSDNLIIAEVPEGLALGAQDVQVYSGNIPLLFDNFSQPNIDTNKWNVIGGSWDINNGSLRITSSAPDQMVLSNSTINRSSFAFSADLKSPDRDRFGLITNYVNGSHYRFETANNDYGSGNYKGVRLYKNNTVVAENYVDWAYAQNVFYRFKAIKAGNILQLYIDGQLLLEYQDPSPLPDGRVGFYSNHSTPTYFDNAIVGEDGLESNIKEFTVNTEPLGAQLCGISPLCADPGESVDLLGDEFGNEPYILYSENSDEKLGNDYVASANVCYPPIGEGVPGAHGSCSSFWSDYQFDFPEDGYYQAWAETNNYHLNNPWYDLLEENIYHSINVYLDGVLMGEFSNTATNGQSIIGAAELGYVTAGVHTVRYDWYNDWYCPPNRPSCAGIEGDSNLMIRKTGIDRGELKSYPVFTSNAITPTTYWSDDLITTTITDDVQSGPVQVVREVVVGQECDGFHIGNWCPGNKYRDITVTTISNPVEFCASTNPRVLERNSCDATNLASPSPLNNQTGVCSAASLSVTFNQAMQNATINTDTVTVLACGSDSQFNPADCSVALDLENDFSFFTDGEGRTGFIVSVVGDWQANSWYQVSLSSSILGANQKSLIPYQWHFRADGGDCEVATVVLNPTTATIVVTETQDYSAVPQSASCEVLDPATFTWSWDSTDQTVATVDSTTAPTNLALGLANGQTQISAATDGISGLANLSVGGEVSDSNFFITEVKPATPPAAPRNSVIRVYFNKLVDQASFSPADVTVQNISGGAPATLNYTYNWVDSATDSRLEMTPTTGCPPPNTDLFCWPGNSNMRVNSQGGSIIAVDGEMLNCANGKCSHTFATGTQIDTEAPLASILVPTDGGYVPSDSIVPVVARATDDTGISHVEFYRNNDFVAQVPNGIEFSVDPNYGTGNYPYGTLTGDVNNDGYQDIVSLNNSSSTVSVLLNNGVGSFLPKADYSAVRPYHGTMADFNGDNYLDIVTVNSDYSSGRYSLLINKGNGQFHNPQNISTGNRYPRVVVAGDFDGDGDQDMAIGHYYTDNNTSQITLYKNDGSGSFTLYSSLSLPNYLYDMEAGDLDGDGRDDIAVVRYNWDAPQPDLYIYYSTDNYGTMSSPETFDFGRYFYYVTIGDFNKDSLNDFAVAGYYYYNEPLVILINNGGGYDEQSYNYGQYNYALTNADLNNDGYPELIFADNYSDDLKVSFNDKGAFSEPVGFGNIDYTQSIGTADFNSDSYIDVVVPIPNANAVVTLLNNQDNTLGATLSVPTRQYPRDMVVRDVNNDQIEEVAILNSYGSNDNYLTVYQRNGQYQYVPVETMSVARYPTTVTAGYFNNDTYLDYAVINSHYNNYVLQIFNSSGEMNWDNPSNISVSVPYYSYNVVAGDIDNDGDDDLIAYFGSNAEAIIFKNDNGSFVQNSMPLNDSQWSNYMTLIDMNGDDYPELVYANASYGISIINNNNGTLSQTDKIQISVDDTISNFFVKDLNGDNRPDILVASEDWPKSWLYVYMQDGNSFLGSSYRVSGGLRWIDTADIDQADGDDILLLSYDGGLTVLYNQRNGVFGDAKSFVVGGYLGWNGHSLASALINGDNAPDIIVLNQNSNKLSLLLNQQNAELYGYNWDTTGLSIGSQHTWQVKAYDWDTNIGQSLPVKVTIMANHCFNLIQDADEEGIDCGGNDCLACPDTNDFAVTSKQPEGENVCRNEAVQAIFNQPLVEDTVNSETVRVECLSEKCLVEIVEGDITFDYNENDEPIGFNFIPDLPDNLWEIGGLYRVTLSSGPSIESQLGWPLEPPVQWDFDVADCTVPVDHIVVNPLSADVLIEETVSYMAHAEDVDNNPLTNQIQQWNSQNEDIAQLSNDANLNPNTASFIGISGGQTEVQASIGSIIGTADIVVWAGLCGNNQLDEDETCDLVDGQAVIAGDLSCADLTGFTGGILGCTVACELDTNQCLAGEDPGNACLNTEISAEFDVVMDWESFDGNVTFVQIGDDDEQIELEILIGLEDLPINNAQYTKLYIYPVEPLQPNVSYRAIVTGGPDGVKDITGATLANDYIWSFTTGLENCYIDQVVIEPSSYQFSSVSESVNFIAHAYDQFGHVIRGDYTWSVEGDEQLLTTSPVTPQIINVKASGRGNGNLSLKVEIDAGDYGNGLDSAPIDVFLCNAPWQYENAGLNYRTRYCRGNDINHIYNSSFILDADGDAWPDGWNQPIVGDNKGEGLETGQGDFYAVMVDGTTANNALRLETEPGTDTQYVAVPQFIPVKPNTSYTLSGYAKRNSSEQATYEIFEHQTYGTGRLAGIRTVPINGVAGSWDRYSRSFTTGSNTNLVEITCALYRHEQYQGILWCDDLQLELGASATEYKSSALL
ncbi:MAG: FG-GAP-like repeat-containing protein, partial [Candidatus Komeilibacteria bacterium]|nr:FG-GAP-like repeat-containing protein [Candidatus Komeilibacteria bacterium]